MHLFAGVIFGVFVVMFVSHYSEVELSPVMYILILLLSWSFYSFVNVCSKIIKICNSIAGLVEVANKKELDGNN